MSFWRQITHGLGAIARPRRANENVDDEVRHYIAELEAELVRQGMSPAEAHRTAVAHNGNVTVVREHVRSSGWEHVAETMLADVRFALRRVRREPAFAAVAVLTLALSIGATTAIFSAVNPILFRALPYPDANRLVTIADPRDDGTPANPTYGTYAELAARAHSISALAVADNWPTAITGSVEPERLQGRRVSANFFHVLGVSPAVGRSFDASEDVHGGPRVVVLSRRLVDRRFAGNTAVVGQIVQLDGDPYRVVGVMPRDFVDATAPATDVWAPLQAQTHTDFNSREWGHHYHIIGRLAAGATLAQADAELAAIAASPTPEFSRPAWANLKNGLRLRSLQADITADARPALLSLLGAVLLLLAIACVNVTNLLLARGAQRRGEFAMRAALGAARGRIARQLVTESVILAVIGGTFGLVVARVGVGALVALSPPGLPRVEAIHIDGAVLLFALGTTTLVGVLVGLLPAIAATRASLHDTLQHASRRASGARGAVRGVLVVTEVALALVLLVSAGLLVRSLDHLFGVAPGFEPSRVLTMQVTETGYAYHPDSARARFYAQALDAVRGVPGVTAAAFTSQLPLSGDRDGYGVEFEAFPTAPGGDGGGSAFRYAVTPDYFRTMEVPLRRGRLLDANDRAGTPEAILISESLARQRFGGANPIGQHVRFGPEIGSSRPWGTIVGVVGDVKQESLGAGDMRAFYVASTQWWWVDDAASLVVRTSGDPAALTPAIKRAIWSVDPTLPITRVATMDRVVAMTGASRRFASVLFESFAITALLLAAIGLYGIISGSVTERTREIGIRTALGATTAEIVRGVVANGLGLTIVGMLFGIAGASIATRLLQTMLFGVTRSDPLTYAAAIALLGGVAVLACWSPARRAASVDPAITLRAD